MTEHEKFEFSTHNRTPEQLAIIDKAVQFRDEFRRRFSETVYKSEEYEILTDQYMTLGSELGLHALYSAGRAERTVKDKVIGYWSFLKTLSIGYVAESDIGDSSGAPVQNRPVVVVAGAGESREVQGKKRKTASGKGTHGGARDSREVQGEKRAGGTGSEGHMGGSRGTGGAQATSANGDRKKEVVNLVDSDYNKQLKGLGQVESEEEENEPKASGDYKQLKRLRQVESDGEENEPKASKAKKSRESLPASNGKVEKGVSNRRASKKKKHKVLVSLNDMRALMEQLQSSQAQIQSEMLSARVEINAQVGQLQALGKELQDVLAQAKGDNKQLEGGACYDTESDDDERPVQQLDPKIVTGMVYLQDTHPETYQALARVVSDIKRVQMMTDVDLENYLYKEGTGAMAASYAKAQRQCEKQGEIIAELESKIAHGDDSVGLLRQIQLLMNQLETVKADQARDREEVLHLRKQLEEEQERSSIHLANNLQLQENLASLQAQQQRALPKKG